MRRFIVGFFAFVGFLTVLLVAGIILLVGGLKPSVTPLPANIVLIADLTRDLPEGPKDPRGGYGRPTWGLHRLGALPPPIVPLPLAGLGAAFSAVSKARKGGLGGKRGSRAPP